MAETRLYIARHGRTMFNELRRIQGWSDTPLIAKGEEGIRELGLGLKEAGVDFKVAVSSDLGRTVQTISIVQREMGILGKIPYYQDKRIREWCFGQYEGLYDDQLFSGVLPRLSGVAIDTDLSFEQTANLIHEADSTKWSEPWDVLKDRIYQGFESIAKNLAAEGGGNALVVSHGVTIGTMAHLVDPSLQRKNIRLVNGSITCLVYRDGKFTIESLGDMSYRETGKAIIENGNA